MDSLGPSQMDALDLSVPAFRARAARRAWLGLGVAACAGLVWLVAGASASSPEPPELPRAPQAAAPSPAPAVPLAVTSEPGERAVETSVANSKPLEPAGSLEAAQPQAPSPVQVAVRTWPPDAALFASGQRLGSGVVTVDVPRGSKVTLVAQKEGFKPRKLILDGTKTTVAIALRRAQAKRASVAPPESDGSEGRSAEAAENETNPDSPATVATPSAPSSAPDSSEPTRPGDSEPL